MSLTAEQRERVHSALEEAPLGDYAGRLDALRMPEELHQFVLNYNCNDGLGPLWWIIRSPLCDRGTALYVYWQFSDVLRQDKAERPVRDNPNRDADGLVREIETRYAAGFYSGQQFAFDPRVELGWNRISEYTYQKQLREERAPFPALMLEATPGEAVGQEWLL